MIQRVIEQQRDHYPHIEYVECDISLDKDLSDRFEYSLPVIQVNDKVVSELKVDGRAIREALQSISFKT